MREALSQLRRALEDAVQEYEPRAGEGMLHATLRPASEEALSQALRICHARETGLLLRGGGTEPSFANAPCTAVFALETGALTADRELDTEEGVALLPAGETVASVHASLAGSGFELPFDATGAHATIGGVVASARQGFRYGPPRDAVLGMSVVLPTGERIRFGGRVVKNVTGYDLNKLFTGSFGSLGVITTVWLRLRPVPECVETHRVRLADDGGSAALGLARLGSARAAVVVPDPEGRELQLELAGDAASVSNDAAALAAAGATPCDPGGVEEAARQRLSGPFRVRVTGLPSAWAGAADILEAAGARVLAEPARGIVRGIFDDGPGDDERAIARRWAAARAAARRASGTYAIEAASIDARLGREVFGDVGASAPLQRAIKLQYDPHRILNPGRFVGNA